MKKWFATIIAVCITATALATMTVQAQTTVTIKNATELANAIVNQADGQVWNLEAGTYDLAQAQLDLYKDIQPGTSGQGNWYFPITKSIQIVGTGEVILTSSVERENGAWASQDFISVWADDVVIENVKISCKKEVNKAIEIMGKNFVLKNVTVLPVTETYDGEEWVNSGSIYFNEEDAGEAKLENVTVSSWISARTIKTGTLTLVNTVIDFSENTYATQEGWGVFSGDKVVNNGLTVKVSDLIDDLDVQILQRVPAGTVVELTQDIHLPYQLDVANNDKNLTIDGKGHTITAAADFGVSAAPPANPQILMTVENSKLNLKDIKLVTSDKNTHALNVYNSDVALQGDVTLDHTTAIKGAPLIVNSSSVNVEGTLNVKTGAKSWYGINVDNKTDRESVLNVTGEIVPTLASDKQAVILTEKPANVTITVPPLSGVVADKDGVYRAEIRLTAIKAEVANSTLQIGESITPVFTLTPADVDCKTLTFVSSDPKVATVDKDGKITAVAAGKVTITISQGEISQTLELTVAAPTQKPAASEPEKNPDTGAGNHALPVGVATIGLATLLWSWKKKVQVR